ncbi:MAG: hypothetical protein HC915_04440 [Anaerolineae bacterium]|nr:hypothetical protein [Anaerolineae bacterium]
MSELSLGCKPQGQKCNLQFLPHGAIRFRQQERLISIQKGNPVAVEKMQEVPRKAQAIQCSVKGKWGLHHYTAQQPGKRLLRLLFNMLFQQGQDGFAGKR